MYVYLHTNHPWSRHLRFPTRWSMGPWVDSRCVAHLLVQSLSEPALMTPSIMVQFDRSNHQIEMTSSQLLTWEPRSPTSSKRNSYCMFKNGAEDIKTRGKFYQNAAIAQKDAIEVQGRRLRGGKATKTETL